MALRHELVWLSPRGWAQVQAATPAAPWDAEAAEVLAHWVRCDLPLVVTRRHAALAPGLLPLGLPAPRRWGGRRLALAATADAVTRRGAFPTLPEAVAALPAAAARPLAALAARLGPDAALLRVYGSHGWQVLCGMPCLRDGSDLDLLIPAPDAERAAARCAPLLAHVGAPRLDGELLLPDGSGLAWREWCAAVARGDAQVLIKHAGGAELRALDAVWPEAGGSAPRAGMGGGVGQIEKTSPGDTRALEPAGPLGSASHGGRDGALRCLPVASEPGGAATPARGAVRADVWTDGAGR